MLINKDDVFSPDLIQAPLILSENLERAVESARRLAQTLSESSKTISSAKTVTELGEATKTLSVAEAELLKIQKQIEVAQARNTEAYRAKHQELNQVKEATAKANKEAQLNRQIAEQQVGSIRRLELELKRNRLAYEQMSEAQRENTEEGKKLLATIQEQDKKLKALKSSIGQNQLEVGNYRNAIVDALRSVTGFNAGLGGLTSGFQAGIGGINSFSAALRSIPIFAIISAISSLVAYFTKTEEGAMRLKVIMSAVGTVFDTLMDYVIALGRALADLSLEKVKQGFIDIGNAIKDFFISRLQLLIGGIKGIGNAFELLFKGEFKAAAKEAGNALLDIGRAATPIGWAIDATVEAIKGLGDVAGKVYDDIAERTKKSIEVAKAENQLLLKKRQFLIDEAKLNKSINEAREEAADAELSVLQKLEALKRAEQAVNELYSKRIALKQEENRLAKIRDDLAENDIKANDEAAKRQAELIQLEADRAAQRRALAKQISALEKQIAEERRKQEIENIKRINEEALLELEKRLNAEVEAIQTAAIRGEITKAEAQKKIQDLRKSMADDFIQAQIDGLNKLLGYENLTAEERAKIEHELVKLKAQLNNALFDQLEEQGDQLVEKEKIRLAELKQLYTDFVSAYISLFKGASDRRIQAIDAEIAKVDEQAKRELMLAGDNEEAKALIVAEAEKKREELENKRRKERQEQARLEKIAAIIEATINTAVAVAKALSKGIPYAIAVGAIGAAQIAAIARQPIPKFAEGTDSAPGGLAIVGERGAELIRTPAGTFLSPDTATLVNLPKGAQVLPHEDTVRWLAMNSLRTDDMVALQNSRLVREIAELKRISESIVDAIFATGNGDLVAKGSLLYEVKRRRDGSKMMIRKRIFG